MKQGDRYAHADIIGAPSCIIKNIDVYNKQIPINEKTLNEACIFSACYSKAWSQYSEVQSYWVLPEQVSKTPQSGEYVPKGGFIIRGKRNYCKCKLEMAIGEIFIDNKTLDIEDYVIRAKELMNNGELDKAFEVLKKTLSINVNNKNVYEMIGKIYELKGDYKEAERFKNISMLF